ncbi:hypothetical protein ACQP2K_08550 [Microbispora siamensis]
MMQSLHHTGQIRTGTVVSIPRRGDFADDGRRRRVIAEGRAVIQFSASPMNDSMAIGSVRCLADTALSHIG